MDQPVKSKGRISRSFRWLLRGTLLVIIGCPVFYFLIVPFTTGQACFDFLSGHVPPQADNRFLKMLFVAARSGDRALLSELAASDALESILQLAPKMSENYSIVLVDDLGGLYERRIRFDNGFQVYLTYWGHWSCPDWIITDEEIKANLELSSIKRRQ